MKPGIFITAVLMFLFGNLGIVTGLHQSPIKFRSISLGVLFIVWGALLLWYRSKNYRGGAASIIGALMLGMAAFTLLENIFWAVPATPKDVLIQVSVLIILALAGIALLKQGHKIHRLTDEQTSADT